MSTVSIIYFSGTGHTGKLAEAIQKGAASVPGVKSHLLVINGSDIQQGRYSNDDVFAKLDASDAIIFGSPTYMGGPSAQFKAFADASGAKWFASAWRDKVASGFSVSSSPAGDKFNTLQYFHTLAMQHGMVWVGLGEMPMQPNGVNRLGSFAGATAQAGHESPDVAPSAEDKLTGEHLGKRVAEFASRLKK
jgi:NAD(P)H dehydrogenase (quinone)